MHTSEPREGRFEVSKCPECGKFLKKVNALVTADDEILKVEGQCRKHGTVETNDWEYWDFYPGEYAPGEDEHGKR
jgi:uncharacterized radical SAM superfamily Fe-S cluster-containing enzyme